MYVCIYITLSHDIRIFLHPKIAYPTSLHLDMKNFCGMITLLFAMMIGTLWSGAANPYLRSVAQKGGSRMVGLIPSFADMSKFDFEKIPPLEGKVALVTGYACVCAMNACMYV